MVIMLTIILKELKLNKTEFRLLREDLHLSQSELSELWGINIRTIQRWEDGSEKIPEKRSVQLLEINSVIDFSAENFERQVVELRKKHDAPDVIALLAYSKDDYDGDLNHYKLHNALIMRCWHRCSAMIYNCQIVLFNRKIYTDWLSGNDSQAKRSQWASLQV